MQAVSLPFGAKTRIPQQTPQEGECPAEHQDVSNAFKNGRQADGNKAAEQSDHFARQFLSQQPARLPQRRGQRQQPQRGIGTRGRHHQNRPKPGCVAVGSFPADAVTHHVFCLRGGQIEDGVGFPAESRRVDPETAAAEQP